VPAASSRSIVLPALALLALGGCAERVTLSRDAGVIDGATIDGATIDGATIDDAPVDDAATDDSARGDGGGLCAIRPIDPPGPSALGVDMRYWEIDTGLATLVFARGHYWVGADWHSGFEWQDWGALSRHWSAAPRVEGRAPWDGTGVTAIFQGNEGTVHVVSRDLFWVLLPETGHTLSSGHVRDLLPPDPPTVDGLLPWEGDGITGIGLFAECLALSGDRYYRCSAGAWGRAGHVSELWPALPAVDGALPWDPPGITAFHQSVLDVCTIVSGDRWWEIDCTTESLRGSGRLAARWPEAPAIDAPCL
jgi:hypothetical protein